MFRPFSFFIGLRYTRAKRRNHFVSFISLVSMIGIALGVTVLITVLSVMNGFDYQIKHRIFDVAQQVTISGINGNLDDWEAIQKKITHYPGIVASSPFINGQAMLSNNGVTEPILLKGINPNDENKVSVLPSQLIKGSFQNLNKTQQTIILAEPLAKKLDLSLGDKVILIIPQAASSTIGITPQFKRFTVSGFFDVKGGLKYESSIAFINLKDAQELYHYGSSVSGLRLKVSGLFIAPKVSIELQKKLGEAYLISNWTEQYADYFKVIKMQKTMMFFILVLIIAVAVFNLVSTLVMIVTDKKPEIAILRTLGASPKAIMLIFMIQGSVVGFIGTFLGLIGGILLALNAPWLVNQLQHVFGIHLISSSVYLIDYLPSRLQLSDLIRISLIAFGLSLLATIYPARQAAKTQPAEALKYD